MSVAKEQLREAVKRFSLPPNPSLGQVVTAEAEADAYFDLIEPAVRREAAGEIAALCHWTQGIGNAREESHEQFHFGYSCPYEAMAAVLRGEPDPRVVPR